MAWVYLVLASFGEIFGVSAINMYLKTKRWTWLVILILVFSFGFYFLFLAIKDIALGTAYAVWTGLGATGAVIMGALFFKEKISFYRIIFLTCIITGAVGLKLISP